MKKFLLGVLTFALFAYGCSAPVASEKERFIDATVEATCAIFGSEDILDPALEGVAKDIYVSHGFDSENEEAMIALTTKYEGDEDVQAAILDALSECAGDFAKMLGGEEGEVEVEVDEDAVMETEEAPEADVVEEVEVVEEPVQ